jgi:hypothetical protein
MGWVRGSHVSPCRRDEELLRYGGFTLVTYVTAVALVAVLLHLGGRRSLHSTKERTRLQAHGNGEGLAWPGMRWESSNARVSGAELAGLAQVVPILTLPHLGAPRKLQHGQGSARDELRRCQK